MGRSIKVGANGMERERHGLGACLGLEGIRRDGITIWTPVELRLRTR